MSSAVSLPNHMFTGQASSSKQLTSIMHILLPETDNPSWISGRERMTVENISWSIFTKKCCRPRRGSNPRPPGLQSDAHPTELLRPYSPQTPNSTYYVSLLCWIWCCGEYYIYSKCSDTLTPYHNFLLSTFMNYEYRIDNAGCMFDKQCRLWTNWTFMRNWSQFTICPSMSVQNVGIDVVIISVFFFFVVFFGLFYTNDPHGWCVIKPELIHAENVSAQIFFGKYSTLCCFVKSDLYIREKNMVLTLVMLNKLRCHAHS